MATKPKAGVGAGYSDEQTTNRTTYVGEGNTTNGFYSPIQELMRMAWARMSGANKNRSFLRSGFRVGGIPGPGWYQNPVTGQWEQRQGTSTVRNTGPRSGTATDIPGPTEPPEGWGNEHAGSYRPGGTTPVERKDPWAPRGTGPREPGEGGGPRNPTTTPPPTTPPTAPPPAGTPPPARPPAGGGGRRQNPSYVAGYDPYGRDDPTARTSVVPPDGFGATTTTTAAAPAARPPAGGGGWRQDPTYVAGYDPYGRNDPTARTSEVPPDGFGATTTNAGGRSAAWGGQEYGVGDSASEKDPWAPNPPRGGDPWRDLPTTPPERREGGGSAGGGGRPEDGSGTGTGEPDRRTPETQNPDMPPGGELPSEVPGWYNDPPRFGDDGTYGPEGGGYDTYSGEDGGLPGGMSGYYLSELAAKGFDPDVENALRNSTMAAVGNSANTARRAMDRRIASTGSDAGYFGARSDLADSEAANTEEAARSNVLAGAQERARRRGIGEKGLMDLTEQEIADEQFWAKVFAGIGTKPRESTGDSSGINVNLGFGF